MENMSYQQARKYVEETKKPVFTVLQDGSEITLDWNDEDLEVWSTYLKHLNEYEMEEDFYPLEDLVKEFSSVETAKWHEGVGLLFGNEYGFDLEKSETCVCCKQEAKYSILLAVAPDDETGLRYYIPNQMVRETVVENPDMLGEIVRNVWFCHECMRKVEDNLRETIAALQKENAG